MVKYAVKKRAKMFHGTTILSVRRGNEVAVGGDGQVTLENTIMKHTAKKVRKMHNGTVVAGFSGGAADALNLFEKFEQKLDEYKGNLLRAATELARFWRSDKVLRQLNALLGAADSTHSLLISGNGDVIEPDDGIIAIGSGGAYALAAARALLKFSELNAEEVVKNALLITSGICIYTNDNITIEKLKC
jgi:ATP-dependent HslUV protease, peptidase subunit HslV